ncbi:MAG: YceD family protein [Acidobacteriota bacterium]|nr:YceD family protein [Acidobacteriota bacterium]
MSNRKFNGAVLDITTLPTEPDHERTFHLDLIAPDDLKTAVMAVPEGSDIPVDITVRSLIDGVLFQANATVDLHAECVRCLDPIKISRDIDVSEMFFTPEAIARMRDEHGDEGVEGLEVLEGDKIELEPLLRDNIVTSFPYQPLCSQDCQGLCDVCGEKWANLPDDHKHELLDPRFAKLAGFFDKVDSEQKES